LRRNVVGQKVNGERIDTIDKGWTATTCRRGGTGGAEKVKEGRRKKINEKWGPPLGDTGEKRKCRRVIFRGADMPEERGAPCGGGVGMCCGGVTKTE